MNIRLTGGMRWHLVLFALAGLALLFALVRFNHLQEEFLRANFDSVHGARTLLKARYALGQAEERLARANESPRLRKDHIKSALSALELAESYGAEGRDDNPQIRNHLVARIHTLRDELSDPQIQANAIALAEAVTAIARLSDDLEAAELERWGTLASLNTTLGQRMAQLRLFIAGSVLGFALLTGMLAWSVLRTQRSEAALQQAKAAVEAVQQTTLDAVPLGIAYVDARDPHERRLLRVNSHLARIFGYAPGELVGMRIAELYPDDASFRSFSEELLPALRRGDVVQATCQMRRRNGELFWASGSGKAVAANDLSRGVVWAVEDISTRRAPEADSERPLLRILSSARP